MLPDDICLPTLLPCTVPLRADQTYWSFVSSLASRNGFASIDHFRELFGRGLRKTDPTTEDVAVDAAMGGVDQIQLAAAACKPVGKQHFECLGQTVRRVLRPSNRQMLVCPECVEEERYGLHGLDRDAAPMLHVDAQILAVTGCSRHGLAYVDPAVDESNPGDLCYHLRRRRKRNLPLQRIAHSPSAASLYFAARMNGGSHKPSPFLDEMPLSDAIDSCALVGGLALSGDDASFRHQWGHTQETEGFRAKGFEVAQQGEHGVRALLEGRLGPASPGQGLLPVFGTLAKMLATTPPDTIVKLRRLVADVAFDRALPFYNATTVLGLPVPERTTMTVPAVARSFGIRLTTLNAILVDQGVIPPPEARGGAIPVVNIEKHRDLLESLSGSLNIAQVAARLGVSKGLTVAFINEGFIEPAAVRKSKLDNRPLRHFRPVDVEAFYQRVVRHAEVQGDLSAQYAPLSRAVAWFGRPAQFLYGLAMNGELESLKLVKHEGTFADLRVHPDEVLEIARASAVQEHISTREAAEILGTHVGVVARLARSGILPCSTDKNAVNHRRERSYAREDLEVFSKTYVMPVEIWKHIKPDKRLSALSVLRAAGVEPAFPYDRAGIQIYRRSDIPRRVWSSAPGS